MSYESIPQELRDLKQWVCWKSATRKGKITKIPIIARKKGESEASSTDPETWTSFDWAAKRAKLGDVDGIGFVFTKNDPYIGIDLDDNDDFGEVYEDFNTYTEYSPSGNGIHIIGKGKLPIDTGKHPKGIGVFEHSRYFTFTGNLVNGEVLPIRDIQTRIDQYWPQWFPDKPEPAVLPFQPLHEDDQSIISRLRSAKNGPRFEALYDSGDTSGHHNNESEADLALCSMISFYTQDTGQIDRIFRSSKLYREKWDRADYRERTMDQSLQRGEFYTPPNHDVEGVTIITRATKKEIVAFNTTDLGNAKRLVDAHGKDIRYCHKWKTWLIWNGSYWKEDENGEIVRRAKDTVRRIYAEAASLVDEKERKAMSAHAIRSEGEVRIRAMISLAQSEPEILVNTDELDTDIYLFNAKNGTVDLRTGHLLPHNPDNMITRISTIAYDIEAECPLWESFLDRIMGSNHSLIDFLQRAIGYSMTGDTDEQVMFILHGNGQNGKSKLVDTISHILSDYAQSIPTERLMVRHGDATIPNDLASLTGVRFTSSTETTDGKRLDESMVKTMTGGDAIRVRFLHKEYFDLIPQFKLWLATNHKPVIRGTDKGIWRRIRLIPFTVEIPEPERDLKLFQKLIKESSGILNWMIVGCLNWQEHGLEAPREVQDATMMYREEMDVFGSFLNDCCVFDQGASEKSSLLYNKFKEWANENGEFQLTSTTFGKRLIELGLERKTNYKGQTGNSYLGLRLRGVMDGEPEKTAPPVNIAQRKMA
jgi:putative DNA primase/helicase